MRRTHVVSAVILGIVMTAAAVVPRAQSQAPAPAQAGKHEPALGGYCPVAYVAMKTAVKGDPNQKSEHKGRTYLFANADAKKMFDAAPAQYLPAYDGYCATAVAQGMKLASDPKIFTVHDGRTYLFSTAEAKAMFDKEPAGTIAKADANWPKVAKASH